MKRKTLKIVFFEEQKFLLMMNNLSGKNVSKVSKIRGHWTRNPRASLSASLTLMMKQLLDAERKRRIIIDDDENTK